MIRSIISLSFITSLLLFYIKLPWLALIPLIISMYITFTNGHFHVKTDDWKFSRYHILFWLWCIIIIWLSLLLHVFWVPLLTILCALIWVHMLVIRWTLIWNFVDEFTMFHIWYYFVSCVLLWYIPVTYWIHDGLIWWLLFPVITFLLYAVWTFFIDPFVHVPLSRHYRTAVFFLISFLSSIILYFFSAPIIGRTAALIFYVWIIRFLVYQMQIYLSHEKNKNIYAEDILAWKRVIQPLENMWFSSQAFIARIIQKLSRPLRIWVVWCSVILFLWSLISAYTALWWWLSKEIIFALLVIALIAYYYANTWWNKLSYPTTSADMIWWLFLHSVFAWVLYAYIWWFTHTTFIFIGMIRTIIHHGIAILLAKQARFWSSSRKYPLLYWYTWSTALASIWVMILFSYLQLDTVFIWAVNLLYLWIIWTMMYFFSLAILPEKVTSRVKIDEE